MIANGRAVFLSANQQEPQRGRGQILVFGTERRLKLRHDGI